MTVFEPDVPGTVSMIPTMAIFGLVLYGSALVTLTKPCLSGPHTVVESPVRV